MALIASICRMMGDTGRSNIYAPLRVVVYSSNSAIRMRVKQALGSLPDKCIAPVIFIDTATQPAVDRELASGGTDLVILDAEATPLGGIGLAKQLKDELLQCPPIVVVIARLDDAWLADWSRADAVVPRPIDPVALREAVIPLLRSRQIV